MTRARPSSSPATSATKPTSAANASARWHASDRKKASPTTFAVAAARTRRRSRPPADATVCEVDAYAAGRPGMVPPPVPAARALLGGDVNVDAGARGTRGPADVDDGGARRQRPCRGLRVPALERAPRERQPQRRPGAGRDRGEGGERPDGAVQLTARRLEIALQDGLALARAGV